MTRRLIPVTLGNYAYDIQKFHDLDMDRVGGPEREETDLDGLRAEMQVVEPGTFVPMSEAAVLPCWKVDQRCGPQWVDRYQQRAALPKRLNPKWGAIGNYAWNDDSVVVKAPASCSSEGVVYLENVGPEEIVDAVVRACVGAHQQVSRLIWAGVTGLTPIVERYVPGPQWEVIGVVGGDPCKQWRTHAVLEQTWNIDQPKTGQRILHYMEANAVDHDLLGAWHTVAKSLGASWCYVCVEFRRTEDGRVVVIDAHCRPGDDDPAKGYPLEEHVLGGWEQLQKWASE